MAVKTGVHLPNDGPIDYDNLRGLSMVKTLVRLDLPADPVDYDKLAQSLSPDCSIVLRLYWPGRLDPEDFVYLAQLRLDRALHFLKNFETFIEIHNEPNHATGLEGWGATEEDAHEFGLWFDIVYKGLKGYSNLGWPGLAVGQWCHGERTWAQYLSPLIESCDWIGCHCYWQNPFELEDNRLGRNWAWYQARFNKPVIVTEAANSSCDNLALPKMTAARQVAEYTAFARQADVYGVVFFIMDGTEDWRGFRLYPETIEALKGI